MNLEKNYLICNTCEYHQCPRRNAPDTLELQDLEECELRSHHIGHQHQIVETWGLDR